MKKFSKYLKRAKCFINGVPSAPSPSSRRRRSASCDGNSVPTEVSSHEKGSQSSQHDLQKLFSNINKVQDESKATVLAAQQQLQALNKQLQDVKAVHQQKEEMFQIEIQAQKEEIKQLTEQNAIQLTEILYLQEEVADLCDTYIPKPDEEQLKGMVFITDYTTWNEKTSSNLSVQSPGTEQESEDLQFPLEDMTSVQQLSSNRCDNDVEENPDNSFSRPDYVQQFDLKELEVLGDIGCGVQGDIYKVLYKGTLACAKFYNNESDMQQEWEMLASAQQSKSVPKLYGVYQDLETYIIVMELCEGKNLEKMLYDKKSGISLKMIHRIVYQLGAKLVDLHAQGIIHNDLKLDNIMVDCASLDCGVRIIDLGMATFAGEPAYPDLSSRQILDYAQIDPSLANGGLCSARTDFYSFGQILLEISELVKCSVFPSMGKMLTSQKTQAPWLDTLSFKNCPTCNNENQMQMCLSSQDYVNKQQIVSLSQNLSGQFSHDLLQSLESKSKISGSQHEVTDTGNQHQNPSIQGQTQDKPNIENVEKTHQELQLAQTALQENTRQINGQTANQAVEASDQINMLVQDKQELNEDVLALGDEIEELQATVEGERNTVHQYQVEQEKSGLELEQAMKKFKAQAELIEVQRAQINSYKSSVVLLNQRSGEGKYTPVMASIREGQGFVNDSEDQPLSYCIHLIEESTCSDFTNGVPVSDTTYLREKTLSPDLSQRSPSSATPQLRTDIVSQDYSEEVPCCDS